MYDPTTDTILQLRKETSERSDPDEGVMTTQEDPPEVNSAIPSEFFLVHTEGGGRELLHKTKWPRLMIPGEQEDLGMMLNARWWTSGRERKHYK
jgi:hypothetical protein